MSTSSAAAPLISSDIKPKFRFPVLKPSYTFSILPFKESKQIEFKDELEEIKEVKVAEKNKCQICNKRAVWNYIDQEYGVRCKTHILPTMINLFTKEFAAKRFETNINKLGGKVIGKYERANKKVECECPEGHKCHRSPTHIQQGEGMCLICSGHDSSTARDNFTIQIKNLKGVVKGDYKNSRTPVECECPEGHKCHPRPNDIQQGGGMCGVCAGKDLRYK